MNYPSKFNIYQKCPFSITLGEKKYRYIIEATLNRWPICAPFSYSERQILNQSLLALFKIKTTNLSTHLASYAILGLADERLIAAVDTLMSGIPGKEKSVSYLVDWGASSGLDTFLGMILAGLQYQDKQFSLGV